MALLAFTPNARAQHEEDPTRFPVDTTGCGERPGDRLGLSVAGSLLSSLLIAGSDEANASNGGYACTFRVRGAAFEFEQRLVPSDPIGSGRFGESVEGWSSRVIVGAPGACGGSAGNTGPFPPGFAHGTCYGQAGAAYIFDHDGWSWVETAKLVASDGQLNDHLGKAVAVGKDLALVSTPYVGRGKVYVYRLTERGWIQVQILEPPQNEGMSPIAFGFSVSLHGHRAMIGAPGTVVDGLGQAGAVYFYEFNPTLDALVLESAFGNRANDAAFDELGRDVDLAGDLAIAGAPFGHFNISMSEHGFVQVFRHNGTAWALDTNPATGLAPATIQAAAHFGYSVAVSAIPGPDHIMVGAPFWDDAARDEGRVFFMSPDTSGSWADSGLLQPLSPTGDERFGNSVDLPESLVSYGFIGAPSVIPSATPGTPMVFDLH